MNNEDDAWLSKRRGLWSLVGYAINSLKRTFNLALILFVIVIGCRIAIPQHLLAAVEHFVYHAPWQFWSLCAVLLGGGSVAGYLIKKNAPQGDELDPIEQT